MFFFLDFITMLNLRQNLYLVPKYLVVFSKLDLVPVITNEVLLKMMSL